jgi:uncharacterized protein YdhG (YjbR/CyaY superfamily)
MPEKNSGTKSARGSTKRATATTKGSGGFTAEERAAIRETARERKVVQSAEADLADVRAKIAEMAESDRMIAERIHAIVTKTAPNLAPKTWYGMPAYARDGKVVCFFKSAEKFRSRYATFGFEEAANLDDGTMWPTSYALTKLTKADEKRIAEVVKQAAS